jgi:phenol hydroxylase P3 protein
VQLPHLDSHRRRAGLAVPEVPQQLRQVLPAALEHWREEAKKGNRFYNKTLPMLCQTCQIPMLFTEPGDPTQICYREVDYKDNKYHFCSDGCKEIFEHEPEKYFISSHAALQGKCEPEGSDVNAHDYRPGARMHAYWRMDKRATGDFNGSEDQKNFARWRAQATKN